MKAKKVILWLQIAVNLEFLGRAWQHFYLNPPYNEIFWNKKYFGWFVDRFSGLTWNEYLTSSQVSHNIDLFTTIVGVIFIIGATGALLCKYSWARIFIWVAWFFLFPFAFFHYVGNWYNWVLLFEFSAQFFTPLLLLLSLGRRTAHQLWFIGRLVIAITFICHGLYAVGAFPVPQEFYTMTINILHVSKQDAGLFLKIFGVLDFVAGVMLFIPKLKRPGLIYMAIWGFFTAFARIYANYYGFDPYRSFLQWVHAFMIRTPHFALPLSLYYLSFLIGKNSLKTLTRK